MIIDENTCMAQDNANKVGDKELLPLSNLKILKHYSKGYPLKTMILKVMVFKGISI